MCTYGFIKNPKKVFFWEGMEAKCMGVKFFSGQNFGGVNFLGGQNDWEGKFFGW